MNRTKTIIGLAMLSLAFTVTAQTEPAPAPAPIVENSILSFLSSSNAFVASYAIADVSKKDFGAGIALGYKLTDYLATVMRWDYIEQRLWKPSISLQLQTTFKLFGGTIDATPLIYDGIATPLTGKGSFSPINIAGVGLAVGFPKSWHKSFLVPHGAFGTIEHWSGSGENSTQFRIGSYWNF